MVIVVPLLRDRQAHGLAQALFEPGGDFLVLLEERLGVFAPLAHPLAVVREPRAALLNEVAFHALIDQVPLARDPLAVHHVELGLAEGRGDLVLYHLRTGAAADDRLAVLDGP